jgi:uncharacterized membrane protein YgaE (UPF0421/DUF939 family)
MPHTSRPFKTLALLAVIGAVSSAGMLFYLGKTAWLMGAVMIVTGLLAYELFKRRK